MEKLGKSAAELDARISELRLELERARGRETEVYTRIVGYYRAVKNWNAGKREEYGQRKLFELPSLDPEGARVIPVEEEAHAYPALGADAFDADSSSPVVPNPAEYLLFERDSCPNCPPVKRFVDELAMDGVHHDVDTEEGLSAARRYGVMASPTVIFLDAQKKEMFRAHSVSDLRSLMVVAAGR
jgi:ribonucleoside-triphosphate reductase